MARWKALLLAGALGWPAVGVAQVGPMDPGPSGRPFPPPAAAMPTGGPATLPPDVPALPGRLTANNGPMAMPGGRMPAAPRAIMQDNSGAVVQNGPAPVGVPDIGGMPNPEKGTMPAGFPPSALAPVAPPVFPCPAPAAPECDQAGMSGVLSFGEVLWMRPRRSEPSMLIGSTVGTFNVSSAVPYESDYSLAYRVGGGVLGKGGFLLTGTYTRYKDIVSQQAFFNSDQTGANTLQFVGPGILGVTGTPNPAIVTPTWELDYSTVDIMAGGVFSPSGCLDLIFGGGARLASIDQVFGTGIDQRTFPPFTAAQYERLTSRLRGAGPRIGGEAKVYLAGSLMLYGRGYTGLLLSHRNEESIATIGGTTVFATYSREEVIPMLELGAGIELALFDGRVVVGGGYEFNQYFEVGSTYNQNFGGGVILTNRHVDLSLEGVSARVTILW